MPSRQRGLAEAYKAGKISTTQDDVVKPTLKSTSGTIRAALPASDDKCPIPPSNSGVENAAATPWNNWLPRYRAAVLRMKFDSSRIIVYRFLEIRRFLLLIVVFIAPSDTFLEIKLRTVMVDPERSRIRTNRALKVLAFQMIVALPNEPLHRGAVCLHRILPDCHLAAEPLNFSI